MKKDVRISVRLDEETNEKLQTIMAARGLGQSDAIRFVIDRTKIIYLGNVRELGQEFCKIRMALETGMVDERLYWEVDALCQSIKDVLRQTETLDE